jgi:hypothetical protein
MTQVCFSWNWLISQELNMIVKTRYLSQLIEKQGRGHKTSMHTEDTFFFLIIHEYILNFKNK